ERYVAPNIDAIPEYARTIVASKPDVIMAQTSGPPLALKRLTSTIPVVFAVDDAQAIGLVDNLAHPGGNLTGTSGGGPQWLVRQVQILKEILPGMMRLA